MKEQYNKPSTESMQSLVGEIKQIIHDARAHAIRSVDFCRVHRTYPKGNALRSQKKQLFMLQQENKDKEANPLTQNYQNTLNLIYLSEALYLSNIGATDKPCGEWMSVAPMIV